MLTSSTLCVSHAVPILSEKILGCTIWVVLADATVFMGPACGRSAMMGRRM
jgi:hypothetical protein